MLNTPEMFPLRLEAGVLSASPSYKSCHRGIRDSEALNARPVNMLIQMDLYKLPSTEIGAELCCEIIMLRPPRFSALCRARAPTCKYVLGVYTCKYVYFWSLLHGSDNGPTALPLRQALPFQGQNNITPPLIRTAVPFQIVSPPRSGI